MCCCQISWLTPSFLELAGSQSATSWPSEPLTMMSSACPVECSEPLSPDRNPPYDVMSGNFAQIARCTRIASGVSPSSTAEPDLQTACEIEPDVVVVAVLATGLVADRYCALTQRDLPALTTSAQRPSTLPETETLV